MEGRGKWELFLFIGYKISVWDNEIFLDMDSGDGCITLSIMSLNYAFKGA